MEHVKQSYVKNPPFPKQYAPEFLVLERGEGVYLFDTAGNRYLDFGSGIAVNALGYGREDLARTAYEQMKKLIHVSNLFTTGPALQLAGKLLSAFPGSPFSAVHFGNSGSEANETAIKYARLYAQRKKGPGNHKLLCFSTAFHGRTMGALSCTPTPKYQEPFAPLVDGVVTAEYNDTSSLEKTLDSSYAGVIVEVLQGEGGLTSMTREFAQALNRLCAKHDAVLIADEVQTGMGRTGTLFASEQVGLQPDIVTLSKPLAGGLPLSATLTPAKINELLHVGEHGTTFGGGPVTAAVGSRVFDTIAHPEFLRSVEEKGKLLTEKLENLQKSLPKRIKEVRGMGLLKGIVVDYPSSGGGETAELIPEIMKRCREKGLLILRSGTNVIRIAPPLIISKEEIEAGTAILQSVIEESAQ
jgi:acetylornithine/N-succinyldiaminopimelate aminotransferase